MTETAKTGIFTAFAVAFLLIAWIARPAIPGRVALDDSGERFFAQFDPLEATSLEIVDFDEETGTARAFKVAQVNGIWSIPSHENYPADAEKQLAEAAASIVDLIKGPTVSDRPADHELYGMIDPTTAQVGAIGVGTRVKLESHSGSTLAEFIIGKTVKNMPELRYVRVPQRDRVYTVAVNTDKLSTNFEDWIERDLLQLNQDELIEITVNDYSIDEFNQRIVQGDLLRFSYDETDGTWELQGVGEDEQLLTATLDDMEQALDDLKIIDVHRKPAGLSAQLRTEDQMQLDSESVRSLQSRGYFIVNGRLLSNQGETIIQTSIGVQYALRFGEIALGATATADPSASADETDESSSEANRYLFVTADFNPDLIPQPQLAELPEIPAATQPQGSALEEAMQEARERFEEENLRKREEYQESLDAGRQKVSQLNDRFADWFYVISDSVYNKIRLTRADVVAEIDEETTDPSTTQPGDGSDAQ